MNENLIEQQATELKKLSFDMLLSIAKAKEPLTYTFESEEGEHQIEVFFNDFNDKKLEMVVAIDSNWQARFDSKTAAKVYEIQRL